MKENHNYLNATTLLDYNTPRIQKLIQDREWNSLEDEAKIKNIYNFVRDEILFGYNRTDTIPASEVLNDGYGQCNTKGILFMALLRSVGISCRMHGFTIDKPLQKGAMTGFIYHQAPDQIVHSWVEVFFDNTWYELEAFILDLPYLHAIQHKFSDCKGSFKGYGIAVKDLSHPVIEWNRNHTYIQSEGIHQDFSVYDTPDEFFSLHSQALNPLRGWIYSHIARHKMNRKISRIRRESNL